MEISSSQRGSIKIKTKNTAIVVDPSSVAAADVVIETSPTKIESSPETKLTIEGPGDYEVGGVHISAQRENGDTTYRIFDDQYKILLTTASALKSLKEDAEFDAILIKVNVASTADMFGQLASEVILLYGDEENIPKNDSSLKKLPKVNLKKKEEVKGSLVYLSN